MSEPTLAALVASPRFRWLPGMGGIAVTGGAFAGSFTVINAALGTLNEVIVHEPSYHVRDRWDGCADSLDGAVPDLDDPGTLGCLEHSLLPEVWGPGFYLAPTMCDGALVGWRAWDAVTGRSITHEALPKPDALAAALLAAPIDDAGEEPMTPTGSTVDLAQSSARARECTNASSWSCPRSMPVARRCDACVWNLRSGYMPRGRERPTDDELRQLRELGLEPLAIVDMERELDEAKAMEAEPLRSVAETADRWAEAAESVSTGIDDRLARWAKAERGARATADRIKGHLSKTEAGRAALAAEASR